jgi:hypothetical protein
MGKWRFDCTAKDAMTHFLRVTLGIQLAAVAIFAQPRSYEYQGDLVNANCMQAAEIVNRNARGYVPSGGTNAFTGTRHKVLQTPKKRKEILRHCSLHPGVTQFALLNDEGNFFKLDEAGNREVLSQEIGPARKMRVIVKGSIDRETLIVQSLSKL